MTTQLALYNYALGHLGEETLTTVTDPYQRRRELDNFYPLALSTCLEAGQWNFAMRTVQADADATAPAFGWTYRFAKPADWVRTAAVSTDEYLTEPLTRYADEQGYWMADITPLFFRLVSNDTSYGGNLLLFPASYEAYVAGMLAQLACLRITQDKALAMELAERTVPKLFRRAASHDAMNGPPVRPPASGWVKARGNISSKRYDRA